MTKRFFRDVKPGDPITASGYNERSHAIMHDNNYARGTNNFYITTEPFHAYRSDDNYFELKLVRLKVHLLPSFLTDKDVSSDSSSSARNNDHLDGGDSSTPGMNAVVLQHNGIDWADSEEELYVSDVFGLPYDKDDRHWVTYHPYFGRWVIIDRNTIRVANTCKDDDGTYPKQEDEPNVYPIEFVTPSYPKMAGKQPIDYPAKQGSDTQPTWIAPPHAYCANIWDNYPDAYIPEGTHIWTFWQWQQWWTFVCCGGEEQSSQSSSAEQKRRMIYSMRKTDVANAERKPGTSAYYYRMTSKTTDEKRRDGEGTGTPYTLPGSPGTPGSPGNPGTPGGSGSSSGGGGTGFTGSKTVVIDVYCAAGVLYQTKETWTYINGLFQGAT